MASVFYLVMFMLYTMMVSNNNLQCEAATSLDSKCFSTLINLESAVVEKFSGPAKFGMVTSSQEPRMQKRCSFVPNATLSGTDLVLCKCKAQDLFGQSKAGGNNGGEISSFLNKFLPKLNDTLNALDADKEFAKSCGFDQDCDAAFQSVQSPCEKAAQEAMNTCAPMVKAAAENDLGNRGRQNCCSILKTRYPYCNYCSSYTTDDKGRKASDITSLNNFLHFVNDTLRDECRLSDKKYNGPVCDLSRKGPKIEDLCFTHDSGDMETCGSIMQKPRTQVSDSALPLIDSFTGCCLGGEPCECDPRAVSCCEKLGELSKKGHKGCMCELLNSRTTLDSTLDFLNFVRSNSNQVTSCQHISPVFTDTCNANDYVVQADLKKPKILRKGFRTPSNPNP